MIDYALYSGLCLLILLIVFGAPGPLCLAASRAYTTHDEEAHYEGRQLPSIAADTTVGAAAPGNRTGLVGP